MNSSVNAVPNQAEETALIDCIVSGQSSEKPSDSPVVASLGKNNSIGVEKQRVEAEEGIETEEPDAKDKKENRPSSSTLRIRVRPIRRLPD